MGTVQAVRRFLKVVTQWASAQADIQALALVGSYARNAARESSDVDLVLITVEPKRYLHNLDWIERFGKVEKYQIENYGLLTSVRVWYDDGPEVEYGLTDQSWAAEPLDEGTRQVIKDGMQVLFERGIIMSCHQSSQRKNGFSKR